VDLLLIVWFVLGVGGTVFCLVMLRRSQRRIEQILAGPRGDRREVTGAVEPRAKAVISIDERAGAFRWEGQFEGKKTTYFYEAESGYSRLQMATGGDVLIIAHFLKAGRPDEVPSLLPYKVEINARAIYRDDLWAHAEGGRIRAMVEAYFAHGVTPDLDQLTASQAQAIETLLFGHHTFRRFLEYLGREFPGFISQMREYRSKPVSELLAAFKGETKSREELLLEMKGAIAAEDYQRAAAIRDQLKALEAGEPPHPE
jgi:hypothetical protein